MDGWVDGWVGGWMGGWMDGWIENFVNVTELYSLVKTPKYNLGTQFIFIGIMYTI